MKDFRNILALFDSVDGMMTSMAGAAFIAILQRQDIQNVAGNIVEFGVYKGKSASVLAHFVKPSEQLVLVDINIRPEVSNIEAILPAAKIIESSSDDFARPVNDSHGLENTVRFLHVDGNHTFDNVLEDLRIAEQFVTDDGLVVLDDFVNPHYPQVQAATFYHLFLNKSRFSIFLIGGNKAFLCEKGQHKQWTEYSIFEFADVMARLAFPVTLAKTDSNPFFDAVYFKSRPADGTEIYGPQLYGKYFQR